MKKMVFVFLTFFTGMLVFAQSSQKVSDILSNNEITKGEASYFICVYTGEAEDSVSEKTAFSSLQNKELFKSSESENDKLSLSKACYLISESAQMKGGIFYSIFHTSRYSFREFKALGIIPSNSDPATKVSGTEFIALLNGFEKNAKTKR